MRKRKNKKNKLINGSLSILLGFLFVFLTYLDINIDKSENNLITYNNNKLFNYIDASELLNVLDKEKGVIVVVNDRKDINRLINILLTLNVNENIYVYNSREDEIILELTEKEIIVKQKPSKEYEKLLNKLGSFTDRYLVSTPSGNYIETEYYKIYTPMVLFVNKGEIVFSNYIHDDKVTDEELKTIYKKGINLLETGKFS